MNYLLVLWCVIFTIILIAEPAVLTEFHMKMLGHITALWIIIYEIIMITGITELDRYKRLTAIFIVMLILTGYCLGIVRNLAQIVHLLMAVILLSVGLKGSLLFLWQMLKNRNGYVYDKDELHLIIFILILSLIYIITIVKKWDCIDSGFIDITHWSPC